MPSYFPAQKNQPFVFFIGLEDAANSGVFLIDPSIEIRDFKVSVDGGSEADLQTLPVASGKRVKVSVSAAEMNGDNITIVCSDPDSVWDDVIMNIQTTDLSVYHAQTVVVVS